MIQAGQNSAVRIMTGSIMKCFCHRLILQGNRHFDAPSTPTSKHSFTLILFYSPLIAINLPQVLPFINVLLTVSVANEPTLLHVFGMDQ